MRGSRKTSCDGLANKNNNFSFLLLPLVVRCEPLPGVESLQEDGRGAGLEQERRTLRAR